MNELPADGVPPQKPAANEEAQNGKVSYETYQKVLNEAKKAKELARSLSEEKAKNDEKLLADQQQWKVLADQYKEQLESTKKVLSVQEESIIRGLKFNEFEKQLGGKLKNRDYATFIDFDKIAINPDSRIVEEASAKLVANLFVKEHGSLVEFTIGKMPNEAPSNSNISGKNINSMTNAELDAEIKKLGKL